MIGIDLGTTNSAAAIFEGKRPRILSNAEGMALTPSVVAFPPDGEPIVGQPARALEAASGVPVIASIKRRMGSAGQLDIGGSRWSPQAISGLILKKIKTDAERALGARVSEAVISVPAYFNESQRQATREAGELAGFRVLRMINEPTAAALTYGLNREEAHRILVWDLGGGTFDVSVLELGDGIFEVKAVSGDSQLGGDDMDRLIAEYVIQKSGRSTHSIRNDAPDTWRRLLLAAERAKRTLSSVAQTTVDFEFEDSGARKSVFVALDCPMLDELARPLLQRMQAAAEQALSDACLAPGEIDRVLLVGGATRMPAVRRLAKDLFGREPYRYVDPDLVVAMGAAIQAAMITGDVGAIALLDVLPLSLGIETQGGLTARLVRRNTPLPAAGSRIFTTAEDRQTAMDVHVLQGERELALDNVSLGTVELTEIPAAPKGAAKVEVAFEVDVDGLVKVSALDLLTEQQVEARFASTKSLDRQEIETRREQARTHAAEDREHRRLIEARLDAGRLLAAAERFTEPGLPALSIGNSSAASGGPSEARRLDEQILRLRSALDHAEDLGRIEAEAALLRALLTTTAAGR